MLNATTTGSFRLDANEEQLKLTVDGAMWGETTFVFSRKDQVLTRDGKEVCKLKSQTYVTTDSRFAGPGIPDSTILTAWTDSQKHDLYFSQCREIVSDLADRINAYLRGASVTDLKAGRDSRWQLVPTLPTEPAADPVPTPGGMKRLLNYTGFFGVTALVLSLPFFLIAVTVRTPDAVLPMLGFFALLFGVGAFFTWRGQKEARRVKAIYENQLRVELPIVARQIDYSPNNRNRNNVEYQYQDANGTIYHATSQVMGQNDVNRWEIGDIADVIVNRNDPKSNTLVSLKPLRKANDTPAFA